MAHYKLDSNMAGAFINMYQPIGEICYGVKSLDGDADLEEFYAYRRSLKSTHEYISIKDMCLEADRFLTKQKNKGKLRRIMEEFLTCKDCAHSDKECMFCDKHQTSVYENDLACPEFEERSVAHCMHCECELDLDRDDYHNHEGMYLCDDCYNDLNC